MGIEGKTILLTRAPHQNASFRALLEAAGARVSDLPTIEIVEPETWSRVDAAIRGIDAYDWIIFTSANAVDRFLDRADGVRESKVAAVGSQTARRLEERGLNVDLIPDRFNAESLLETLPDDLRGVKILLPRAEAADEAFPRALRGRGARLDVVVVYRVRPPGEGRELLRSLLEKREIDCIPFTSGSSVRNLIQMLGDADAPSLLAYPRIAVIGPVTRQAALEAGLGVDIEPARATIRDLADAICRYFENRSGDGDRDRD